MGSIVTRISLVLALLSSTLGAGALARAAPPLEVYAAPQRLVRLPDGRRMNLFCTGSGSPTVVLEAGWGNTNLAWRRVQPLIARTIRVCSYDRAGLGFSDPAPGPRDAAHIAQDLEQLLRAARVPAPYVLVGYSMGGLSVRRFAERRPGDVAGMVLVEASGDRQTERFEAALPQARGRRPPNTAETCADADCKAPGPPLPASVRAAVARQAAEPRVQQALLAELLGMTQADTAGAAPGRYGAMPLIVLTGAASIGRADYSAEEVAAFRQVWNAMHDEMAALSTRGEHRQVPGASHLIVFEQPQAIADAVIEVARQARN